jgi:hypothetical protein
MDGLIMDYGMDYEIGTKFKTRGKAPRFCEVVDIFKTYNSRGELIKTRYVATHNFLGQCVTDYDVSKTTIAMGIEINS